MGFFSASLGEQRLNMGYRVPMKRKYTTHEEINDAVDSLLGLEDRMDFSDNTDALNIKNVKEAHFSGNIRTIEAKNCNITVSKHFNGTITNKNGNISIQNMTGNANAENGNISIKHKSEMIPISQSYIPEDYKKDIENKFIIEPEKWIIYEHSPDGTHKSIRRGHRLDWTKNFYSKLRLTPKPKTPKCNTVIEL